MLHLLKRHPLAVKAHFQFALVLTFAFEQDVLAPLLPPGLQLDTFEGKGFLAIAMVQTRQLRPLFMPPWAGQDFFLTGYRVFVKHRNVQNKITRRGLRILRSDTDRRLMAFMGNRLTHYNYRLAKVRWEKAKTALEVEIRTPNAEADLHVIADLADGASALPQHSPFLDLQTARRFAGPLPFTFDYERETHSIIRIEGVRSHWNPRVVAVNLRESTFFEHEPFEAIKTPQLASAFYIEDVPYRWKRGVRETLAK